MLAAAGAGMQVGWTPPSWELSIETASEPHLTHPPQQSKLDVRGQRYIKECGKVPWLHELTTDDSSCASSLHFNFRGKPTPQPTASDRHLGSTAAHVQQLR